MCTLIVLPIVAIICTIGQIATHETRSEPMCTSRFDYESKMLERIVMVEHKMNLMEESMRKEKESLMQEKTTLKEKVTELEQTLRDQQNTKIVELEQLSRKLTEEHATDMEQLEQLSREMTANVTTDLQKITEVSHAQENNHIKYLYELEQSQTDFEAKINASINDRKDSDTMPKTPVAFYLWDPHTTSPGPFTLLRFTTPILNENSGYDITTGQFTAAVPGVYLFTVQLCVIKNLLLNFRIYVNNKIISDTSEYDNASSYRCSSTTAIDKLKIGDQVKVMTGANTSQGRSLMSVIYRRSSFLGVLIQPL